LELNVTARGDDLADVEKNLRKAIELYLEDMKEHPETVLSPISTEEFIEFLQCRYLWYFIIIEFGKFPITDIVIQLIVQSIITQSIHLFCYAVLTICSIVIPFAPALEFFSVLFHMMALCIRQLS